MERSKPEDRPFSRGAAHSLALSGLIRAKQLNFGLRPRLKLRRPGGRHVLQSAVFTAVGEIDNQADNKPNDKPRPINPSELVHHVAVEEDSQKRHKRTQWRAERPRLSGIGSAQHHDGDANDDESQQRADIHHFADIVDRRDAADDGCQQANQDRVLIGCAEFGMDARRRSYSAAGRLSPSNKAPASGPAT